MPVTSADKLVAGVATEHVAVSMGPTDLCKTPAPPAPSPVPMPYPVEAPSAMVIGTTKTFIEGAPIWTKDKRTAACLGDQPGTALGVLSNNVMGPCSITGASPDVDAEGGGVVRTLDPCGMNGK